MARGKTDTARLWIYVRDDRPFAGPAPPAALFHYARDRRAEHPRAHLATWSGILQADAYAGYNELYAAGRLPGPVLEAGCFAHARRKFFELADVEGAARKKSRREHAASVYPIALEAVQKLDALFEIERTINGRPPAERLAVRKEHSTPLMDDLHSWLQRPACERCRATMTSPRRSTTCCAAGRRSPGFSTTAGSASRNNAAERALRCVPLGRKAWLFCGSDRGGERAAVLYSLIQTARLNNVDPQAWLADVLARIAGHPAQRLEELLPWHWKAPSVSLRIAA